MSFKMIYDERNRKNLNQLADTTKVKAYQWYQYCIDNKIQVLIYETIRSKEKQAENVRKGASKTMKSYHIVGQALDWVLVDAKKNALWNGYNSKDAQKAIKYAKSIGFVWGGDWKNFYDAPHLQWDKIPYGKDTFKNKGKPTNIPNNSKEEEELQFTSATLKKMFEERKSSEQTAKLLDDLAVKNLKHTSKLKNGKLADGDLVSIALELAVHCAKEHK